MCSHTTQIGFLDAGKVAGTLRPQFSALHAQSSSWSWLQKLVFSLLTSLLMQISHDQLAQAKVIMFFILFLLFFDWIKNQQKTSRYQTLQSAWEPHSISLKFPKPEKESPGWWQLTHSLGWPYYTIASAPSSWLQEGWGRHRVQWDPGEQPFGGLVGYVIEQARQQQLGS